MSQHIDINQLLMGELAKLAQNDETAPAMPSESASNNPLENILKPHQVAILIGSTDQQRRRECSIAASRDKVVIVDKRTPNDSVDLYEYEFENQIITKNQPLNHDKPAELMLRYINDFIKRNKDYVCLTAKQKEG